MREIFSNFFFRADGGRWLSFLRIVLGLALVYEGLTFYFFDSELFHPQGLIQAEIQNHTHGYSFFSILNDAFAFDKWRPESQTLFRRFLLAIFILASAFMAAGFKPRLSTITTGLLYLLVINSSIYSIYGVDQFLALYVFYLVLISLFPVDWFRSFMFRIGQITLALSYTNAGFAKSFGNHWWTGESIWRVINQPNYYQVDLTFLGHAPWIFILAGWLTLFFESLYPVFVSTKYRQICVYAIICLHLGIALFMGLWFFALVLIALNIVFFLLPPAQLDHAK